MHRRGGWKVYQNRVSHNICCKRKERSRESLSHWEQFLTCIFMLQNQGLSVHQQWCWRWEVDKEKTGETFFCLTPCDVIFYLRSSLESLMPNHLFANFYDPCGVQSLLNLHFFFQVSLRGHQSVISLHIQFSYYIFWLQENWTR